MCHPSKRYCAPPPAVVMMYLLVLANGNVTASSAATKRSRHDWRVLQLSQSDCQPGHFWNGTVCER
eukprot:COSAG01_NODE_33416_length_564_cov_1.858065_1_plen_65_part_10